MGIPILTKIFSVCITAQRIIGISNPDSDIFLSARHKKNRNSESRFRYYSICTSKIGISNPDYDIIISTHQKSEFQIPIPLFFCLHGIKRIGTLNPDHVIILSAHLKSEFQIPISVSYFHHGIKKNRDSDSRFSDSLLNSGFLASKCS